MEEQLKESPLLVSIQCITYNHESYIRHCLDGFVMQKTNFRFEVIVHDDASTDNTVEIIRQYVEKYPDIIKPIYEKENQYSKIGFDGIFRIMNEHSKGKYIAICEGDDYWIDPFKLQKQVDFLENHTEYGMIHTYFNFVDMENNIIPPPTLFYEQLKERIFDGYIWDYYLVNAGFILTCTCMYRKSLYKNDEQIFFDHGLFMMIARSSKVYCLREITSAYRRTPTGAMMSNIKYYIRLCQTTRLYQLSYLIKKDTNSYYYRNKFSRIRTNIFLIRTLKNYFNLDKAEKKLLETILHNLSFSFGEIIYSIYYFIKRKKIKASL